MSMKPFGLVRIADPGEVYNKAMNVITEIEDDRKEDDLDSKRKVYINYLYSFWWRFWNLGLKDAFFPMDKDDLTSDEIESILTKISGWGGWKSSLHYARYKMACRVSILAAEAIKNNSDLFLSEEHLDALNNPKYWNGSLL